MNPNPTDSTGGGALSRRTLMAAAGAAGVTATLWSTWSTPAAASTASAASAASAASPVAPAKQPQRMERGGVRQYARPRIAPGHRLVLPAGATILPSGPVRTSTAWPYAVLDGKATDLGQMPPAGSPSASAIVAGFAGLGWYEIRDPHGTLIERREWNAYRLPYLRLHQEWGATHTHPYWGAFYTLRLEPVSLTA